MNTFKSITASLFAIIALLYPVSVSARSAILVTHYGSSDDNTRSLTIDKITEDITAAFPDFEVRQAYISPVVRKNLAKKGIEVESPVEALLRLKVDGFDTVFVQSTTIIDGIEMEEVRKSVREVNPFFSFISVGEPLLYTPDDCDNLVDILAQFPCGANESVIYVGHGNFRPSTATYTQLDYMFRIKGHRAFHVSTIEGYPDVKAVACELADEKNIRKVTLLPLLLVCGNHTKIDIAGEFADSLKELGYDTSVVMRGLAELPLVRQLYVDKVRRLISLR